MMNVCDKRSIKDPWIWMRVWSSRGMCQLIPWKMGNLSRVSALQACASVKVRRYIAEEGWGWNRPVSWIIWNKLILCSNTYLPIRNWLWKGKPRKRERSRRCSVEGLCWGGRKKALILICMSWRPEIWGPDWLSNTLVLFMENRCKKVPPGVVHMGRG